MPLFKPIGYNDVGYQSVAAKTTTYTALLTDSVLLGSGSAFTITLPTAVGNTGKPFTIIKTDSSFSNIVTVKGNGSELVGPSNTFTLVTQSDRLVVVSDGANWQITSHTYPISWTSYTPTLTSVGTATGISGAWRRVGDSIEVRGRFTAGTVAGTAMTFSIPSGLTAITVSANQILTGSFVSSYSGANVGGMFPLLQASDQTNIAFTENNTRDATVPINANSAMGSNAVCSFSGLVPINAWPE